jgi:uncharacterized membrane protein
MSETASSEINLEKTTRGVLIVGILVVSGFIAYNLLKPNEEYVLFALLNEDMELGNYNSHLQPGNSTSLYFYLENHMQRTTEFNVRMYQGNESSYIKPSQGILNATLIGNFTHTLENNANWTSFQTVRFDQTGMQFVGFEVYKLTNNGWSYIENHTIYLRINVTASI